jgi:hypothetical protein
MSAQTETSLNDTEAASPPAPDPIKGIPTLQFMINLLFCMCCCAQTHRSPASKKMKLLFCPAKPDLYAFLCFEAYPVTFSPFPPKVAKVPDYTVCTNDNKHMTLKETHALDKKTRSNIVTMNAAFIGVFLDNLSAPVCASFQTMWLQKPNIVFIALFDWFVNKYGKSTSEDCRKKQKGMATDWHPADGFENLVLCIFSSGFNASCASYPMVDHNIVNIGLRVIKQYGMYTEDYKAWIACKSIWPNIVETLETFKDFWSSKISLVSQTAIFANLHGYGMAAVNNKGDSIVLYDELIANFGAAYAATQELVKNRGMTIESLQGQINAIQQYCMALQQPCPPYHLRAPTVAARTQHPMRLVLMQWIWLGQNWLSIASVHPAAANPWCSGKHTPTNTKQVLQELALLPCAQWQHRQQSHQCKVCQTRMDHNLHATCTNTMSGSMAGMHKTSLPLARGPTPPRMCQRRQIPRPTAPAA